MTDMKNKAQKVWNTYIEGYSKLLLIPLEDFDTSLDKDIQKILSNLLQVVVNELGYDNYQVDGDHGLAVVNVRDILALIEELKKL